MPVPREFQTELEKRDEMILALEMLAVDQASRLLAIEAIVVNFVGEGLNLVGERLTIGDSVKDWIERESGRYRARFESISGFTERAQRIANDLMNAFHRDEP